MTYPFPPPEWFQPGAISYLCLLICKWLILVCVPTSVVLFWIFKPPSILAWVLAEIFWVATLLPLMWWCSQVIRPSFPVDVPETFLLPVLPVLLLFAFPSTLAGINELMRQCKASQDYQKVPTWECSVIFGAFILFLPFFADDGRRVPLQSLCKFQLRTIGVPFQNFSEMHGRFPDSTLLPDGLPPLSWRVEILPFLDRSDIYNAYNQKSGWNAGSNTPVAQFNVKDYTCPAVPVAERQDPYGRFYTSYVALNGADAAFPAGRGRPLEEFSDGRSNTALISEACGQKIVWTELRDVMVSAENIGINLSGEKPGQSTGLWSSYHRRQGGGANVLLADGSVRFLNAMTDAKVLRALTTVGGKEQVGDF